MAAHPGHPLLQATDRISDSRTVINSALYQVKTHSASASFTANVETHGTHILVDASGGAVTVTLPDPTADPHIDARFVVKKTDVSINAVTVDTTGAETIDGAASTSLANQWDSVSIWNDGTDWYIE